ncbi:MAG: DUF1841 family protein [Burkholderiaceae bacterium]
MPLLPHQQRPENAQITVFDPSQADVRRFFCDTWRKHLNRDPLTPLESVALSWIERHPEYHGDLADREAALVADYPVEAGRTNPFLHLSMHLAIAEQLSIDQPPGIKAAHARLSSRLDDAHEAAHRIMECLGEVVWRAQRDGTPPDGEAYLECIHRQAGTS